MVVKLLSRLTREPQSEKRMSFDEYLALVNAVQGGRPMTSFAKESEPVALDFASNAEHAFFRNGPIFSLVDFRARLFSQVRWSYQRLRNGRPGDLWSDQTLDILNGDPVLNRWLVMMNDLAGNFYGLIERDAYRIDQVRITNLRPDWVQVIGNGPLEDWRTRILGYAYFEGGIQGKTLDDAELFPARNVIHWYEKVDPLARWRGMSWITPVAREIAADNASTSHKLRFFDNGATPNLVFKFDPSVSSAQVREFKEMVDVENAGVNNAYKNLYLGGGADVTVVGSDLRQLEFTLTQGKGESRLASAAGVPAVLVGFSEGLQAATYSNFSQARRACADSALHPLWVSAAGALAKAVPVPADSRVWYDARDIPFLREDAKDDAEIRGQEAQTIRTLVDAGYKPDSVVAAVKSGDWSLLQHTDLFSVQLQPPGSSPNPARNLRVETDERGYPLRLVEER